MKMTKQTVAKKLAAYLHHKLSLEKLVDWAENAMLDGNFDSRDAPVLSRVVARLGVADVRAFGLCWDDCEALLRELGFQARVNIVAA